jgi:ketosteroid isomerase-like protein
VKSWALVALAVVLAQDPKAALDRLRASWSRQDAAGIVAGATRVVVQLPGEAATAPLATEQAARALARLFVDASEVGFEVDAVRALGNETVYAEMRRRFRVRGSDGTVEQRVFAAFRLDGGRWRLVELRVGTAGR